MPSALAVVQDNLLNDVAAFVNLFFSDDEGGRKPDNVSMRRFSKKSVPGKPKAEIPRCLTRGTIVDDNRVKQSLAAHKRYQF